MLLPLPLSLPFHILFLLVVPATIVVLLLEEGRGGLQLQAIAKREM